MTAGVSATDWTAAFPGLAGLEPDMRRTIVAEAQRLRLPQGTRIFGPGQAPQAFLLLIEGVVRVQQTAENGREIVLYRVAAGESCALTTACLLGYDEYQADGVAETDIDAVAIPRATFDDLIARSEGFRRFVFTAFSHRVTDLFRVIEDIAFSRMDIRLAQRLLERAGAGTQVSATHQELAAELGTAREVVSRLLTELSRRHWIAVARGTVTITDRTALRHLAASASGGGPVSVT